MKEDIVCVIYVGDITIACPNPEKIDDLTTSVGMSENDEQHKFELRDEGQVGDFFGICIEKGIQILSRLNQASLIEKTLRVAGTTYCNLAPTPTMPTPLGIDNNGAAFEKSWF